MIISLLVAVSENNVIGNRGELPWKLPNDLKHFKDVTVGHPIIMGRKTYESIGRVLPDRLNIIISRQEDYEVKDAVVVHSFEEALKRCEYEETGEVCVIGGGEIYKQALPFVNRIHLTRVHTDIEGDTVFPELFDGDWKQLNCEEHKADDKHAYDYSFLEYVRKT